MYDKLFVSRCVFRVGAMCACVCVRVRVCSYACACSRAARTRECVQRNVTLVEV